MKLASDPRAWLSLLTLLLVLLIARLGMEDHSPGLLHPTHAALSELASRDACDACHGGPEMAMSVACAACHLEIDAQIESGTGLHGQLVADKARACGSCHLEHHGDEVPLVGPLSFRRTGFDRRDDYDHRGLHFGLEGRHATLNCADCHPHADTGRLEPGQKRFLGLTQSCTECHEDVHAGEMSDDCASCHGQEHPFEQVAAFAHDPAFPLAGAHAASLCADCHAADTRWSIQRLKKGESETARTCVSCHPAPHAEAFSSACEECHPSVHGGFRTPLATLTPAQHALTGFELAPPHDAAACEDCHAGHGSTAFAARFPGRSPEACELCHADPHGGQFTGRSAQDGGCLGCHAREAFLPHRFDATVHARTAFTLTGSHAAAACEACHTKATQPPDAARQFRGTPRECVQCHADVHADVQWGTSVGGGKNCEQCHDTQRFDKASETFDHAASTGFALRGSHARSDCSSCHVPGPRSRALERRLGFVADAFPAHAGDPDNCAGCHADVHAGRFALATQPTRVEGREGCARCHDTEAFLSAAQTFDHGAWTGFALRGSHARTDCASCHVPPADSAASTRRLGFVAEAFPEYTAAGDCAVCHEDVHAGRFDAEGLPSNLDGRVGCARCHETETFSAAPGFEHARWTGFRLEGAHQRATCESCHGLSNEENTRRRLGRVADLFPGSGDDCATCHADPHAGQFKKTCESCHSPAASFRQLTFNHGRDARFALDATHAALDCAACHVAWPTKAGTSVVRYRPLGTQCADCHTDGKGGRR